MMAAASVYSRISDKPNAMDECEAFGMNLRPMMSVCIVVLDMAQWVSQQICTDVGRKTTIGIYRVAQRLYRFN